MGGRLRREVLARLPEPTLQRIQRIRHRESPSLERPVARPAPAGVEPATVHTFDAHAVRAEVAAAVAAALERAGVLYVVLPGPRGTAGQVAVAVEDRPAAVGALEAALVGPGWALTPTGAARATASVLKAYRVLAAPRGQILCGPDTACEIAFWPQVDRDDVPRIDGGMYRPGTRLAPTHNGVVRYLDGSLWERATTAAHHWPLEGGFPEIFEVREPVDLVYTWVDGRDPAWQARKNAHTPDSTSAAELNATSTALARYLDRDELRYSLRSVAMYAGWVRRIFLVTDGQVPDWLDTAHPQIVLVDHRDIFRDPSALPTFNSHAIESQLHHIEGLAEQYVYVNDDMFFGRPVFPELFFHANGLAKFFLAPGTTLDLEAPSVRDLPVLAAAKNQRALLETDFGVTVRQKMQHGPHPQLRSVAEEMEQRYPQLFADVARSRFRHPADYSIPSSLQHYYAYARARAVPAEWHFRYVDIGRETTPRRLDQILRERPQAFCLNDLDSTPAQLERQHSVLTQFFGEYFPLPAPWERT